MARVFDEKRQKDSWIQKYEKIISKNCENQNKIADRNLEKDPINNIETDKTNQENARSVYHERTNAKTSIQDRETDNEHLDTNKITQESTKYNIETYEELTPRYRNIAQFNYHYEDLMKNLEKEKHLEGKVGDLENEDSVISLHGNLGLSMEEHSAKTQSPQIDFLSYVEPVKESQEKPNAIEHNGTLNSKQEKPEPSKETVSCSELKAEPTQDKLSSNEPKPEAVEEKLSSNQLKAEPTQDKLSSNEPKPEAVKEKLSTTQTSREDSKPLEENSKTIVQHESEGATGNEVMNKFTNRQTAERGQHVETTVNEKQDVTNNKDKEQINMENNMAKEYKNKEKEQNNKEMEQNINVKKPKTPKEYTLYESSELDSYREPAKDYDTNEHLEGKTYEEYHHESKYTELPPPPQKEKLDPEDVKKDYKGPKKPRIDDDKVYDIFKMHQQQKEYKESNRRVQDEQKKKDVNKANIQEESPENNVNKLKYILKEMKKKFKARKANQIEDEKKQRKDRIQLLKDYYHSKFGTLNEETRRKVNDYPAIENTEEIAGFPADWYGKNKEKIRTLKELEQEDKEEDLDRERRDKMAQWRKKRELRDEQFVPKSRKKRSTKVMLRKNNKTYVISTKYLTLFRRKNVKIYLNHEHVRHFENRRKKRHVADKIDEGFDSENEFNGKYPERTGDEKSINLDIEARGKDIDGDDPDNVPIYLDSQDIEIRHVDDKTESFGTELRAEDIVDTNYNDPRETEDMAHSVETAKGDISKQANKDQPSNNANPNIEQIGTWVNMDTKEIETWLNTKQTNDSFNIEGLNTPDIDSVDMNESGLVAESDDDMRSRVKREADFVYVTRPKRGWKKHIKDKIREIKAKLSTKFKDRVYEWTTKHKWETLPDEKDRTTPTLMKKRFLNIKKICQML
ncbi:hypothetical protein WDU94_000106 [Cyamophila willieti]